MDIQHIGPRDPDEEDTEAWLRKNSTWKVRKVRRESKKSIDHGRASSADRVGGRRGTITPRTATASHADAGGAESGFRDVEDVGEGTGLLSEGKEREAKREKLAKVALNGTSLHTTLRVNYLGAAPKQDGWLGAG